MQNEYTVVTELAEISRLNKLLGAGLSKTFTHRESREITYPAGHHTGKVFFEKDVGEKVRAWSHHEDGAKLLNFLLSGVPRSTSWMEISVQLNFPAKKYNRMMAGAFVRDFNGDVFVAHRGKLTKGHAGLRKEEVFREFAPRLITASDQNQTSKVILIASLDDPHLADRLWEFANEAREIATKLGTQKAPEKASKKSGSVKSPNEKSARDSVFKLRDYFDEYSGTGDSKGHSGGKRVVIHGDVVRDLERELRNKGLTQKSQAIDLALVTNTKAFLYEVKTSSESTNLYTGVGQLLIHGEGIRELLALPIERYLVLPNQPAATYARHITRKGNMRIVTYCLDGKRYKFEGLMT
ncbi:MAG: hypothetical protein Q8M91_09275 [Polaromonas sp.]|nr:hypothetical protein [Polaromonas sp.]